MPSGKRTNFMSLASSAMPRLRLSKKYVRNDKCADDDCDYVATNYIGTLLMSYPMSIINCM